MTFEFKFRISIVLFKQRGSGLHIQWWLAFEFVLKNSSISDITWIWIPEDIVLQDYIETTWSKTLNFYWKLCSIAYKIVVTHMHNSLGALIKELNLRIAMEKICICIDIIVKAYCL